MKLVHSILLSAVYFEFGQYSLGCFPNPTCNVSANNLTVNCSDQGLTQVPEHLPGSLTNLDLSYNNLTSIPEWYFANFSNLTNLNISNNHWLGLECASVSFIGLGSTSIKVLHACGIVRIDVGCVTLNSTFFKHLMNTSLKEIYLDRNRILTIEKGTFSFVPSTLELLSMRHSRLILSVNVCHQFLHLKNVKTLDISYLNGEYYSFDGTDAGMVWQSKGRRFDKNTKSQEIPIPPTIEKLFARYCYFTLNVLEKAKSINFTGNNLTVLNLNNNRIRSLKCNITGLEKLEELHIADNNCEYISPNLPKYLPNLKKLILSGNKLRFRDTNITNGPFKYLETLDLSSNKIQKIHKHAFCGYSAMQSLILKGNNINNFHVMLESMPNLTFLDLSENQIGFLNYAMRRQLDNIGSKLTVHLAENPLTCACNTLKFIRWIRTTKVNFDNETLTCLGDTDANKNVSIDEILEAELESMCTSHVGIAMGGLVAVTGCLVVFIMGIVYRYRWKLRYLYYLMQGKYRGNLSPRNEDIPEFEYDAFISYAEEDAEFAVSTFINKLEREAVLTLCLHQRDFRPGKSIASNILSAIQKSRHVVIVLSPNFLDSYWCRWEFEMARMEGLYTERNVVVLVRYQEVIASAVPRDMLYMMHTHTYIKYPHGQENQNTFWRALSGAIRED